MPDREALSMVIHIEGDELAARQQTFSRTSLLIEATREQHIIGSFSVARSFKRERCCGDRGVPRWPASGQARPRLHVELSRGWLSPARGISSCLCHRHEQCAVSAPRAGARTVLCCTGIRLSEGCRCDARACIGHIASPVWSSGLFEVSECLYVRACVERTVVRA